MDTIEAYLAQEDPVLAFAASSFLGKKPAPSLKNAALGDPRVRALLGQALAWPWPAISSHKSANQGFHALAFLAELGFRKADAGLQEAVDRVIETMGDDGLPRLPFNVGEAHGGTGKPGKAWALCDAPVLMYALSLLGAARAELKKGIKTIASLSFEKGWPCAVSPELGSWRGPGKKSDPCPYATLMSLKLLLVDGETWREEISRGVECLLSLWDRSRAEHPYIFYMGTDFRKPKLPWIWYDIVHVLEVLSRSSDARTDKRFKDMLKALESQAGKEGLVPGSVYLAMKEWDFGQKKAPSAWMGFAAARIRSRLA
jgi:hypothetical protein